MDDKRRRDRVPLPGTGWGIRSSDGTRFEFTAQNYSIAGLLIDVTQGELPPVGERVGLTFRADRLEGTPSRFTITAEVLRHEVRGDQRLCGVKLLNVKGTPDKRAMVDTWLEQLFASKD
jgi:hypothetical protein